MKIHIVRHTAVDVEGLCYGQTDVPLKGSFEQEAEIVKQKLKNVPYDAVLSSPLSRAKRLAEYCGYTDIQLFDRLKEMHMGDWEMKEWSEMDVSEWEKDWVDTPTPNGESFMQLYYRVSSLLDELKTKDYSSVIIFAHGGVINCFRIYFGKSELTGAFENMPEYGEVMEFEL
ncbi:alpha-ribazole phosphatase [Dysgonomonas hofstadii]|uniref:Alpha-ribazole phosphatase n=1 Tax=Dysgonomonas hofstadii TaxID=637886 RepID=A0A840CQR1_9BACT|nr:alpha-ribazole phosphatase [Dysgonomonas hofstadii]MBB4035944.1 alpha-ribazole phosphatase [Dysgonomonas hofstadii]